VDSDHVTRLRAGACEVGVGVVRDNGGVCGRQCLHGGHRGARVVLACAVAASGQGGVHRGSHGARSVAMRRGGRRGAAGRVSSGRCDSAVRQAVVRGVPAAAWCLRVCDGAMSWQAGARRWRQWSSPMRRGCVCIRGRSGGGLGSGCGLDWYGTCRGSWRGRGGDFASVARHRSMAVCVRGSVGDGSERSGPGEIGVAAVVGGDEQFVPVRALMGDF